MTCSYKNLPRRLIRRKAAIEERKQEDALSRRLTVFDLLFLGVGTTLGAGAYIISGQVAKTKAGPAAILSFVIAAVCSGLAALSYAEFGARVPKAGSVYSFSYVAVGEFAAFFIGWNILLEYIIGNASVARAATGYIDFLSRGQLYGFFSKYLSFTSMGIAADYMDPLAFALLITISALIAMGAKESSILNSLFTVVNIIVLLFVVIAGAWHDDPANWSISINEVMDYCNATNLNSSSECGVGGFLPFGVSGVTSGAATAFFAFVGFDAIAVTGEEALNPQRNIPIATGFSLLIIFVIYSAITVTVTMMSPYFKIDEKAPFAVMFEQVGWVWATKVVTAGAICALTASLIGGSFPPPRIVYTMAQDGLLFKWLAYVHPRSKTALAATMVTGFISAILALIFDVASLVDMMSIGTLMAYSTVSFCTLLLRYEESEEDIVFRKDSGLKRAHSHVSWYTTLVKAETHVSAQSEKISKTAICCLFVEITALSAVTTFLAKDIGEGAIGAITLLVICAVSAVLTGLFIWRQPQSKKPLHFKVPLVPLFPALSILSCVYLAMQLDRITWLRFLIWSLIGQFIYFAYGIHHSEEETDEGDTTSNLNYERF